VNPFEQNLFRILDSDKANPTEKQNETVDAEESREDAACVESRDSEGISRGSFQGPPLKALE